MQQQAIRRTQVRTDGIARRAARARESVNTWLAANSRTYSRITGEDMTRLEAVRVNAVALCVVTAAACAATSLPLAAAAAMAALWNVRKLNEARKGGAQ